MRIKINIEVTPEEVRTLIGLPDIKGIQDDLVDYVRDKMSKGAGGVDEAASLLKQLGTDSVQVASGFQKKMSQGFAKMMAQVDSDEDDDDDKTKK